ncbi:MAG: pseudaminic acid synthase [Candidatus Lloydbacteria bacterium CG22_combo_CG10-13_8_21_14_all_47_15]|uniref:Pseudaminic acid synthase n=1 Tax=Candidatus Lloydbacteria bacterium CG22_combo_CG10-13_8_21_14_all_47_15 TaxID=1974635 RepID=A0A2H0CUB1_9BACT|nr:MAG: pseudaminic acid synthase [Candidatus Lloydbacteria bacterium CG22_combo_CG10-13_8_21_14_all_47_15]
MQHMYIGKRVVGIGCQTLIVAELSANHLQSYANARNIIDAVRKAGAHAIKLQTYTADTITIDSDKEYFQVKSNDAWKWRTLYQLYNEAYTPWEWQPHLKKYAESKGLICFSSPFDITAVDFLEELDMPAYKVSSFEVTDIPLLERIGRTRKPVIMSCGMASVSEINLALATLKGGGCPSIALLHCVSAYPATPAEMNLATIPDMRERFGGIVGLSDHTLGTEVPVLAVAFGAAIIEKHVTLSRKDGGPDASFSLEPDELRHMVDAIRQTEKIIGTPCYGASGGSAENVIFRKSLFAVSDIRKGESFTEKNVRSIRPGNGLAPKYCRSVWGRRAAQDIERGTPMQWAFIAE